MRLQGLALAGVPLPTDRVIDGKDALPVLLGTGPSAHTTLFHFRDDCPGHCSQGIGTLTSCNCSGFPLGAPKQKLYAARIRNWKAHFITKSGFGRDPPVFHDPPLLFNVDEDPAEMYPVPPSAAPAGVLESIVQASKEFEAELVWSRAMNAREDPIYWPCCTAYPRPAGGVAPPNDCRCPGGAGAPL